MRQIVRYTQGGYGHAAPPLPERYPADELHGLPAGYCGKDAKVDLAILLPGGMTQDAEPGVIRFLHAGCPEPVIGLGG